MNKLVKIFIVSSIISLICLNTVSYADEVYGTGTLVGVDGTVQAPTQSQQATPQTNGSLSEDSEVDWLHNFKEVSEEELQSKTLYHLR